MADEGRAPGQLADDSATTEDHEEKLVGELQPATELGPEERAIHIEPD